MKKPLRNILILILAIASILAVVMYITSLRENIALLENQKQNLLQDLEKEKKSVAQLSARNTGLKSYLKAAHKKLNRVKAQMGNFDLRLSILRAENQALSDEKQRLAQENASLKMKFNSVDELKKAMRELKRRAKIEGNRGFLIKDGQLTTPAKVKIEVIPVPKEQ
ncbi:MAG: hypothetical protein KA022_02850 [Candidatus Omnitrophica bacterium]|jgi:chromosome segregation ATPase|nr:hypothetical protein [Candidatus Omnitrophota bacterium]MDD5505838.1 hypothetical protein [Candidatus Omnitrophota bacterium]